MKHTTTDQIAAVLVTGSLVLTGCSRNEDNQESAAPSQSQTVASSKPSETSKVNPPKPSPTPGRTNHDLPSNVKTSDQLAEKSQRPAPAKNSCSSESGQAALHNNIAKVPPRDWEWDTSYADPSTYDPCAALSWILVPTKGGTTSSPYQIMLFHNGEYLGTATSRAYGYWPKVTRANDASINVVYHYARDGEAVALHTGETYASFTWDDAAQRVVMRGNVPPT